MTVGQFIKYQTFFRCLLLYNIEDGEFCKLMDDADFHSYSAISVCNQDFHSQKDDSVTQQFSTFAVGSITGKVRVFRMLGEFHISNIFNIEKVSYFGKRRNN